MMATTSTKIGNFIVTGIDRKYSITVENSHHNFNAIVIDKCDGVEKACNDIREYCKHYKVVGFDAEWKPTFRKGDPRNRVALIQIAPPEGDSVYLFRLNIIGCIPPELKQILEDTDIVKVGVSPDQDRRNIFQDFNTAVQSTLELRILYKTHECLAKLSKCYLGLELDKDDWKSNWARETLTVSQICYAALDAYTAVQLFKKWDHVDLASEMPNWDTVRSYIDIFLDRIFEEANAVFRMIKSGQDFDESEWDESCLESLALADDTMDGAQGAFCHAVTLLYSPPKKVVEPDQVVNEKQGRRQYSDRLPIIEQPETLFRLLKYLDNPYHRSSDEIDDYFFHLVAKYIHDDLKVDDYRRYFEPLIYMEYYEALKAVEQFNKISFAISVDDKGENILLELDKVPSHIKLKNLEAVLETKVQFTWKKNRKIYGVVREVEKSRLFVSSEFRSWDGSFLDYCRSRSGHISVKFLGSTFSTSVRLYSVRRIAEDPSYFDILFPKESAVPVMENTSVIFYNKCIEGNKEQADAVMNIVNGTSKPAPYIIFGPPGTGKTTVLVEAILQLALPENKILVCAPSNSVCDYIAKKCTEYFKGDNTMRFMSKSYSDGLEGIRSTHIVYETYDEIITISTLSNSFHSARLREGEVYTHVFIDEAGFAIECDAITAILELKLDGQLILAGDPKQLAPVCLSRHAEKFGLALSFLQRLFDTFPIYKKSKGAYNNRYISMLRDNYRCHPQILSLSNRLFYDNMLRAKCMSDPVSGYCLRTRALTGGASLVFHAVSGFERQHSDSFSYHNDEEITQVVHCVGLFLSASFPISPAVKEEEIGVVTPYMDQVRGIRTRLTQLGRSGVTVGTVGIFQGQEKRVIIVSTVRSQREGDRPRLGFVRDPRRFNVMITRASAKCIVIGNPYVLQSDKKCWGRLIQEAIDENRSISAPRSPLKPLAGEIKQERTTEWQYRQQNSPNRRRANKRPHTANADTNSEYSGYAKRYIPEDHYKKNSKPRNPRRQGASSKRRGHLTVVFSPKHQNNDKENIDPRFGGLLNKRHVFMSESQPRISADRHVFFQLPGGSISN